MKTAIFFEGESEGYMLEWFFRNHCPQYQIVYDPYEFRDNPANCVALFCDCGCDDNVLPKAREYDFLFSTSKGILLRDLKMSRCYSEIIDAAKTGCPNLSRQEKITLITRPGFETLYAENTSIIRGIMIQRFDETHGPASGKRTKFLSELNSTDWGKPGALKSLTSNYQIAFQKPDLSNRFFSQFGFINSQHPYFVRLRALLQPCITCL